MEIFQANLELSKLNKLSHENSCVTLAIHEQIKKRTKWNYFILPSFAWDQRVNSLWAHGLWTERHCLKGS